MLDLCHVYKIFCSFLPCLDLAAIICSRPTRKPKNILKIIKNKSRTCYIQGIRVQKMRHITCTDTLKQNDGLKGNIVTLLKLLVPLLFYVCFKLIMRKLILLLFIVYVATLEHVTVSIRYRQLLSHVSARKSLVLQAKSAN